MRISDWSSDVCSSDLAKAIVPDYALGTHVAALGLTFSDPQAIPASFSEGAFIGEHGSFNRNPPAGYKVVFVPFRDGKPSGNPVDFLSDFVEYRKSVVSGKGVSVRVDLGGRRII